MCPEGVWEDEGSSQPIFKGSHGEILNWWPKTGTISCQGKNSKQLSENLESALNSGVDETTERRTKIFVVHEHDKEVRDQLELVLHRLDLDLFILQNTSGGGQTLIDALEKNINEHVKEIVPKLAERLSSIGISIDPAKIATVSS